VITKGSGREKNMYHAAAYAKGYGEPRRTPRLNDPAEFNGASREKYRQDPQD